MAIVLWMVALNKQILFPKKGTWAVVNRLWSNLRGYLVILSLDEHCFSVASAYFLQLVKVKSEQARRNRY